MTTKIPNIAKIQKITAAAKVEEEKQHCEALCRMDQNCAKNIKNAAKSGSSSTMCDSWITDGFIATLRAGGYQVEFINTVEKGESIADANYPPHYSVKWSTK